MSTKPLSVQEIQAVGSILKDKEAINLLKEIRDNVITDEDTKGKRKSNEVFNFVGFSSGDDLLGEDSEAEDYKSKKAKIDNLVASGLVLEGFHIPLERKSEKKYGDSKVAAVDEKIYKYQLTNEGYAILSLVEDDNKNGFEKVSDKVKSSNNFAPDNSKQKQKEVESFKSQQNKELQKS